MRKLNNKPSLLMLSVTIVAAALLFESSTEAMRTAEMTVTIPFDVYLRFQRFPSGTYTVKHYAGALFQIRNQDGKAESVSTNAIVNDPTSPLTRLVFSQYGDKYFLTEVYWWDGSARRLPKATLELELAKQTHSRRVVLDIPRSESHP